MGGKEEKSQSRYHLLVSDLATLKAQNPQRNLE